MVCAGRALTLALLVTLGLMLIGQPLLLAWLLGASLAALVAFGYDKWAAQHDRLRVPERVLLGLTLVGGSPGALVGMVAFRHKTRKGSFLVRLGLVLLVQVALVLAWR